MYTEYEIKKVIENEGTELAGYAQLGPIFGPMWAPFWMPNENGGKYLRVACQYVTVSDADDRKPHTVLIGFDGEKWYLGCGNNFLDGQLSRDEAELVLAEVAKSDDEYQEMLSLYDTCERNTGCNHWRAWYRDKEECKHTKHVFTMLDEGNLQTIKDHFYGRSDESNNRSQDEILMEKFETYNFKRHMMVVGEKGSGKTYGAYAYLKKIGIKPIFVGGTMDTEALDLKGQLIPFGKDEMIWKDGPVTRAFRLAAKGEKVVLMIDEILRLHPSGRDMLIPCLTTDIDDCFVLDTGRIVNVEDGIAETEVIHVPRANLWVIATTNIGAGYSVQQMEDAFEDRFELFEKNNEEATVERSLKLMAEKKGFEATVPKLMTFYKNMLLLRDHGMLNKLINQRHLVQALEDCESERDLKSRVLDRTPKWVERDMFGKLLSDQVDAVVKAVKVAGL